MRSPRFLINPRLYLPCSPTPAGLFLKTILRFNTAPALRTTKAPALEIFVAQSHGFYSHCLRFTIRSPYTCKTRFRLVVSLYRVRLDTHRVETENFKCFKEHYSNSSGLAWRDTVLFTGAVLSANKLRSKRYDLPHIRMHQCRLKHLMVVLRMAV